MFADRDATGDIIVRPMTRELRLYEEQRRPATANVVYRNRTDPPDAILREVCERSGDRPFSDLDALISREELDALCEGYRLVAGYSASSLGA